MSGFQGGSGHFTQDNSVILSFAGDTVSIFGAVGPNLGPFTIKSDGKTIGSFDAPKQNYVAQKDLYHADDISAGDHTFEGLAIDFALVAALRSASGSSTSLMSASATASASSGASASPGQKQMSMALEDGYIAASIGAACLIATLVGLTYCLINRRTVRREAIKGSTDVAAFTNPSGAISLKPVHSNVESETAHLLDPRSTAD
ncbi:hypothetical protein B0H13DRAFT_1924040 [Mycena leptocephala]|nr:hypothetical protein B0H13DRAFT_1924040 [Mycena leptocephala]